MPDYSGNVSATVKLERDLGLLSFVSSSKHSGLLISEGFFFSSFLKKRHKTRPLCRLQIFNVMAFHLLNLQIKPQLRPNCSAPWHGDCHHPMSAFLQRAI